MSVPGTVDAVMTSEWTPHRREDRELLGWIRAEGDGFVAVDLLGRPASPVVGWVEAEEALEDGGLAWLAEIWMLEREDSAPIRVRIAEVFAPDAGGQVGRVVVHTDDFGAIDVPITRIELPWPAPDALRLRRPGEASEFPSRR